MLVAVACERVPPNAITSYSINIDTDVRAAIQENLSPLPNSTRYEIDTAFL